MYYSIIDKVKDKPWAFVLTGSLLAFIANFLGYKDFSYFVFFIGALVGSMLAVAIIFNPLYAIVFNWMSSFILGFIVQFILKIHSIPLGILFEGINILAFLVLLFRSELTGFKTLVGKLFLLWLMVCSIELINPLAASRVAWIFGIRQLLFIVVPYFVIYSLLVNNKKSKKALINTWITFSVLAALYTIYQEFAGIPAFQFQFYAQNEELMSLIFTFGRMRKMSFFDGPMSNGMVLAMNSVICLGLSFEPKITRWRQVGLLFISLMCAWAMIFTGTRTATVLFVFGAAIYVVLSRNRELIMICGAVLFLILAYISATGGGAALFIMTTAFNPEEDPSMLVRLMNQRLLRGYLFRGPIGYGLGSTGSIGSKFSPHTFLGSFPPDSELVRIAIETGIAGLSVYLFIMYSFVKKALSSLLFNSGDHSNNLKKVFIAILFMLLLGQYPQEILNVLPLKVLFAFALAYISLTKEQMERLE